MNLVFYGKKYFFEQNMLWSNMLDKKLNIVNLIIKINIEVLKHN